MKKLLFLALLPLFFNMGCGPRECSTEVMSDAVEVVALSEKVKAGDVQKKPELGDKCDKFLQKHRNADGCKMPGTNGMAVLMLSKVKITCDTYR